MSKKFDTSDSYHIFIYNKIMLIAPWVAISAAITFTISRLLGAFDFVDVKSLVLFDVVCFSYSIVAYFLKKKGIIVNGKVSKRNIFNGGFILDALVILQWNLITYIFPTRSFWGYAPMFVLLTAFMFKTEIVAVEVGGLSVSIAISWLLIGDKLLPIKDEFFEENLILRIVALVISFAVILILTFYAEKFTRVVKETCVDLESKNEELENTGKDMIDFTADIIEERDATSGSHVKRLKAYTRILAEQVAKTCPEYKLDEDKINQITLACVLHDVGKIGIPDNILLKPGKLTPEEYEVIKSHTVLGARIIDKLPDSVGEDYKRYCKEICLFHHERDDGSGYPTGIKGDDIPISAQIVSVVDCYDALSNERPYKNALPGEVAINMILNGECGAFSEKMKNCISLCKEKLISK